MGPSRGSLDVGTRRQLGVRWSWRPDRRGSGRRAPWVSHMGSEGEHFQSEFCAVLWAGEGAQAATSVHGPPHRGFVLTRVKCHKCSQVSSAMWLLRLSHGHGPERGQPPLAVTPQLRVGTQKGRLGKRKTAWTCG